MELRVTIMGKAVVPAKDSSRKQDIVRMQVFGSGGKLVWGDFLLRDLRAALKAKQGRETEVREINTLGRPV